MKHLLIGTAGHIDHGKTALIKALTGFDGDETNEEKQRQITIDLSFSNLTVGETNIAFIDVPGHEKLVKNMIAGAFGFDALLLAVAADDGVMEQTIEHLHICDALGVSRAIAVITKADKVSVDRVREVETEIAALFDGCRETKLTQTIAVSIYDLAAIARLKTALLSLESMAHNEAGFFRYYCDRVFTIKGAGLVVTGTVLGGTVKKGDKLIVCNAGTDVIVRGIQVHNRDAESASAGFRAALNLKGVELEQLSRGSLIAKRGFLRGFNRIGVAITPIGDRTIEHNALVELFIGADRLAARTLITHQNARAIYAEVLTDRPIFACFGDRVIIRNSSSTIGGGRVLLPVGDPMRKEQKIALFDQLEAHDFVAAFATLCQVHHHGFGLISSFQRFGLNHNEALKIARDLPNAFVDSDDLVVYDTGAMRSLRSAVMAIFAKNARALLSVQTIAERFKWASRALCTAALEPLVLGGELRLEGALYKHPNCDVQDADAFAAAAIFEQIDRAGFEPLAPYNIYDSLDLDRAMGDEAMKELTKAGKIVRLEHNLFIAAANLQKMMDNLRGQAKTDGFVDVQSVKSRFGLSRKYAVAYLEHLDLFGDVRREENRRYLVSR
ncbi:selenocysteine-specific translation elongation factor [Campylobacterota bacterium]|nr:selenocysteine-specific translation elongation factor [Campylobacterota bacterium]